MKIAAIVGRLQGGTIEKPDPVPKDDIVLVKVHAAPMCTEYHLFVEGKASDNHGHEAAGEVVAVDKATKVKVGDRVVVQPSYPCGRCYLCESGDYIHCQDAHDVLKTTGSATGTGTMAQYLLKPESLLTPIPDGMSFDHGAMACCGLGPTFGAMQLMHVDALDTVLISGLGPVGLGGVINARRRGARVIAIESHPYRTQLALELGAEVVVNPRDKDALQKIVGLTDGIGADKSIETSGVPDAKPFLLDATRRKGQVSFVGWGGQVDVNTIISKGLTLHGAWHYNFHDAGRLMKVIQDAGPLVDKLITHTFPLERVQEAWTLQVSGNCGKVLLHPWEVESAFETSRK